MPRFIISLDIDYNKTFEQGFDPDKVALPPLVNAVAPLAKKLAAQDKRGCIYGASASGVVLLSALEQCGHPELVTKAIDLAAKKTDCRGLPVERPHETAWSDFVLITVSPSNYLSVLKGIAPLLPAETAVIFPWAFEFFNPEAWLERLENDEQATKNTGYQAADTPVREGDQRGEVIFSGSRVLRRIATQDRSFYAGLLGNTQEMKRLINKGLVPTHVLNDAEKSDVGYEPDALMVEHTALIPHSAANWTMSQFIQANAFFLNFWSFLHENGYSLQDCHKGNVMFLNNRPVFVDLCSIGPIEATTLSRPFLREFFNSWLAPGMLLKDNQHQMFRECLENNLPWEEVRSFCTDETVREAEECIRRGERLFEEKNLAEFIQAMRRQLETVEVGHSQYGWDSENYHVSIEDKALTTKERIFSSLLDRFKPRTLFDMGCNKGRFSYLAAAQGIQCFAVDTAESLVDKLFLFARQNDLPIQPFYLNATRFHGLKNPEKTFDMVIYLAIIHHLSFSAGMTIPEIVQQASDSCGSVLLMEYVRPVEGEPFVFSNFSAEKYPDYTPERLKHYLLRHFGNVEEVDVSPSRLLLIATR